IINNSTSCRIIPWIGRNNYLIMLSADASASSINVLNTTDGTQLVHIAAPFIDGELPAIRYAQIGDVMYVVHGSHAPQILIQNADDSFTLANFVPYYSQPLSYPWIQSYIKEGNARVGDAGHVPQIWS